jgi:putative phosphoesterase
MYRVGLISDTHGLLRPAAVEFLRGCDYIVHGGDVGGSEILDALAALAPLTVVRGNNDRGPWAQQMNQTEFLQVGPICIYVIHDLNELDIDPGAASVNVVISGHSHQPLIEHRGDVLYVNPGSAGPRRFKLPIAIAELIVAGDSASARVVELATA